MDQNPFHETRDVASVPNFVFEKQSERYMRIIKWLVIVIVILIVALTGYVIYTNQYETVSWEQEAEASGNSRISQNGSGELMVYELESEAEGDRTP